MATVDTIKNKIRSLTWADIIIGMKANHLENHFDMSDSDLIHRAVTEKIYASTTFDISREEVVENIKEVMLDEEFETPECIAEWLDDLGDDDEFVCYKEYDKSLGHGYLRSKKHNWNDGALPCSEFNVILGRIIRNSGNEWYIKTVYCRPVEGKDY